MLVWRKLSSQKWLDSWEERLAFLGSHRLVVTQIAPSRRIRLEIFDVAKDESLILLNSFGGEVRDLNLSTADWVKSVIQKKPITIRNRLKIVNGEPGPARDPKAIYIPANMAFGTGEHATTAGCLRLLADIAPKSGAWSLLDVGTGTGILAISAAKLGATEVSGFDFDPTAIRIAKQNARMNQISNIRFYRADVLKQRSEDLFDIITANLYSDLFKKAAPDLWRQLRPGGLMIVSGVMRDQLDVVLQAIQDLDGQVRITRKRGKWVTILAARIP